MTVKALEVTAVGVVPDDDDGNRRRLGRLEAEVADPSNDVERASPNERIGQQGLHLPLCERSVVEDVVDQGPSEVIRRGAPSATRLLALTVGVEDRFQPRVTTPLTCRCKRTSDPFPEEVELRSESELLKRHGGTPHQTQVNDCVDQGS